MRTIARLAHLLVALILAAPASGLEFQSPAVAEGMISSNGGQTVFLSFAANSSINGSVEFPTTARIETYHQPFTIVHTEAGPPPENRTIWNPPLTFTDSDGGRLSASVWSDGVAGLLIEAQSVRLVSQETAARIAAIDRCLAELMTDEERESDRFRRWGCPGPTVGLETRSLGRDAMPFSVEATGVRVVEFYGMGVACSTTACPSGGGRVYDTPPPTSPVGVQQARDVYGIVDGWDGTVLISGTAASAIVFGPTFDVRIDGLSRFPRANSGTDDGLALPPTGNKTLSVAGVVDLHNITLVEGQQSRLSGTFSGFAGLARQDERIITDLPTAATAVGIAVLIGVLPKVIAGLLTSLRPRQALKHPKRRALMDYIKKNPGATFRELLRGTQISSGTARHHVQVMERAGLIVQHEHRQTHRYFESHGGYGASWNEVVLLREPELKRLHDWIRTHPQAAQKSVLAASDAWGWGRSTTQHRLKRLVEDGLVSVRTQGRLKLYTAAAARGAGAARTVSNPAPDPVGWAA